MNQMEYVIYINEKVTVKSAITCNQYRLILECFINQPLKQCQGHCPGSC